MDFMPESTAVRRRDRAHQIITGNRTDHQIPCSPFTMVDATSSSYTTRGSMLTYCTTGHSSTIVPEEEEEDMANCLIMLSHSVSPPKQYHKSDLHNQKTDKIKNRRLTEIASTTAGGGAKSGLHTYYDCKTCNRAFPSFQALGGHRASHKKPKLIIEDRNSVSNKTEFSEENQPELDAEYEENKIITNNIKSPSPSPGFIQSGYRNSKGKVHECSICGSEFLSGQALGGHMRRHRTAPASSNQIVLSTNMDDDRSAHHHINEKSPVLSLDLNLPAPEVVDDVVRSNFQFTASSSQQPLVFPAAALVNCHY